MSDNTFNGLIGGIVFLVFIWFIQDSGLKILTRENRMTISIKRIHRDAKVPSKAHATDAAFDLFTPIAVRIKAGSLTKVPLGIQWSCPSGFFGYIVEKSGLALAGLEVKGGVIDSSYRGEISAILRNSTSRDMLFDSGDKIAQLLVLPVVMMDILEVSSLDTTERGEGGFGSSGK